MRASDRDREHTVARLGRGYADGLLGPETLSHRVDTAYHAKSVAELRALTQDLPRRLGDTLRDELATVLGRLRGEDPAAWPTVCVELPPDGPGPWVIGRSSSCRLVVDHDTVSRRHAELSRGREGWEVRDLGSTNGTRVNGWRVERAPVGEGDDLLLGGVRVRLYDAGGA